MKILHRCFPESKETQRGHMRSQRKGMRSTRPAPPSNDAKNGHLTSAETKQQEFIAKVYNVKHTVGSNQTGQFPKTSICGNKYQMCLHEIDSNTTWI